MFKTSVAASYDVIEVNAGLKEMLKKASQVLFGLVILSQTALGFNIKDPKALQKTLLEEIQKTGNASGQTGNYEVKLDLKQKGGLQDATYVFKKDGKVLGSVHFLGTKNNDLDHVDARLTDEGKENYGVGFWVPKLAEILEHRMEEK